MAVCVEELVFRQAQRPGFPPKVIPHFFGEKPCLKLMYGVLDRVSGRWVRVHLTAAELEQLVTLRAALGLAPWK